MPALLSAVLSGNQRTAKCWDTTFGVLVLCRVFCPLLRHQGCVPVVGGYLYPSVTAVPWGDSPKVQGGPWAPPPCGEKSSETLLVLCLVFVRFLWDGCWVFCLVFFLSLGLEWCLVWCPLRPDPLFALVFVVPSFSFSGCLGCSPTSFFSLFLFLSGAGEPQTPFGVWGSPCVSSSRTRTPTSIRTSCSAPLAKSCPAPVFFFFFVVVARWYGGGRLRLCSGFSRFVVVGCCFWPVLVVLALFPLLLLACKSLMHSRVLGRG